MTEGSKVTAQIPQRFAVVLVNCSDPARVEEFDRWYSEAHIPAMLDVEGYVRGTRYTLAPPPQPGDARTVVFYELNVTEGYRPIDARRRRDLEVRRQGEYGAFLAMVSVVATGYFEQAGERPLWPRTDKGTAAASGAPPALYLELFRCTDYARAEDVDSWIAETHLPGMLGLPGIRHAVRYRWPRPHDGQTAFLVLYEVGSEARDTIAPAVEALAAREQVSTAALGPALRRVASGLYELQSDSVRASERTSSG